MRMAHITIDVRLNRCPYLRPKLTQDRVTIATELLEKKNIKFKIVRLAAHAPVLGEIRSILHVFAVGHTRSTCKLFREWLFHR